MHQDIHTPQDLQDYRRYKKLAKEDEKFKPAAEYFEGRRTEILERSRRVAEPLTRLKDMLGCTDPELLEVLGVDISLSSLRSLRCGYYSDYSQNVIDGIVSRCLDLIAEYENNGPQ